MGFRRFLARLYDLPNAFRVLDIMDEAGISFEIMPHTDKYFRYCRISCPYYVTEKDANDLQTIVQYKQQFKPRSTLWTRLIFRSYRKNARILRDWPV